METAELLFAPPDFSTLFLLPDWVPAAAVAVVIGGVGVDGRAMRADGILTDEEVGLAGV